MTLSQRTQIWMASLALIVTGLGAADWYFRPEHARTWAIGVGTMFAVWLVASLTGRISTKTESQQRFVLLSAILAGAMLAVSLGAKLAGDFGLGGSALSARAFGVMMGLVLVVMSNAAPKVLSPLAASRCPPEKLQSMQRFSGWAFVIAGLGYMAAWIFLPVAQADAIATPLCAAAVVLVLARLGWTLMSSRRASST